jgi:DnaK suppressor protein
MANIHSLIENKMARQLSPNTIKKFKKRLEAERDQLLAILEQHKQEREKIRLSEASAERSPDPTSADGGSMAFELEKELTLDENTRHLLNQIEHALVLIKKKKYGNCENCGEPIPVARLEALPYATLRKECAEALEA